MATLAQQIKDFVLEEVKEQLSKAFQSSVGPIKGRLQDLCSELIASTPAYASLIDGELLGELGVPNIKARLDAILNTIKNSLEVAYSPIVRRGNNLSGGLIISILKADFQDILQSSAAIYQTEKGQTIPWLDWLLTQGDRIIVLGYDVVFSSTIIEQLRSRTGKALMKPGSGWRLPPEFSGTIDDNVFTKAFDFDGIEDIILKIVEEEITRFF
jgi:hypothetical protein